MKKRLNKNQNNGGDAKDINGSNDTTHEDKEPVVVHTTSPQQFSNSTTTLDISDNNNKDDTMSHEDISALVDESFWSEVVSVDNSSNNEKKIEGWEGLLERNSKRHSYNNSKLYNDDMEFWFDLFTSCRRIEAFSDIPEF